MLLIPAIDLKGVQFGSLRQGRMDDATVFSANPASVAKRWADEDAESIHVVYLDGAFKGALVNLKVVEQIVAAVNVPVQIGGGIRDEETVQRYLNAGVEYIIIGTKAVHAPHFLHALCRSAERRVGKECVR